MHHHSSSSSTLSLTVAYYMWTTDQCSGMTPSCTACSTVCQYRQRPPRCWLRPWQSLFTHTHASVTKQYNLVPASGWWCSAAGKAKSNGSLPLALWLQSPAGWLPSTGTSSGTYTCFDYGTIFTGNIRTYYSLQQPQLTPISCHHQDCSNNFHEFHSHTYAGTYGTW